MIIQANKSGDMIAFSTRKYYQPFLDLVKSLPSNERRYSNKVWYVTPHAAKQMIEQGRQLGLEFSGVEHLSFTDSCQTGEFSFLLDYISVPKRRANGSYDARGMIARNWEVVFPMECLTSFFGFTSGITYYSTLGISETAAPDVIKKAYRRAARTWHPDVNKDPEAEEQFKTIDKAYKILSNENLRSRYDLGLYMQSKIQDGGDKLANVLDSWRPPVRCGKLTVYGTKTALGINVERIISWEDIMVDGKTMISWWSFKLNSVVIEWKGEDLDV